MKTLIVGTPDPDTGRIMDALSRGRHESESAETAEEAMERLSVGGFDLVLLNGLPSGLDELALCRRLSDPANAVRCGVMLVAEPQRLPDPVAAAEAGAWNWIPKPVDPAALEAALASAAQRAASMQARNAGESALRDEAKLLRSILDSVGESISVQDLNYRIVWQNEKDRRDCGDLIGRHCYEAYERRDEICGHCPVPAMIQDKRPRHYETKAVLRDGQTVDVLVTSTPLLDEAGEMTAFIEIAHNITDRKKIEEELRRSREMLQLVMDNIPEAVFWKDRESRYLGCSRQFVRDAGAREVSEIVGKTDDNLPWAEFAAEYKAMDRRVMESNVPALNYEERYTVANGQTKHLRTSKVPLHDNNGEPLGVLAISTDITEQKEYEARLRRRLAESKILSALAQSFFRRDPRETLLFLEENTFHLALGDNQEDTGDSVFLLYDSVRGALIRPRSDSRFPNGWSWSSMFEEEPVCLLAEAPLVRRTLESGLPYNTGNAQSDPLHQPLPALGDNPRARSRIVVPVHSDTNTPIGVLSVSHARADAFAEEDVLFLKQAAGILGLGVAQARAVEYLRVSEERYRTLMECCNVGIWQITPDGVSLSLNGAMCEMLEVEDPADLLGRDARQFIAPECQALVMAEHAKRQKGLSSIYEVTMIGRKGSRRQVVISGAPLFGPDGKIHSLLGTFIDVTIARRAEEERRRMETQMQHAQKLESLGVLAGGIAHDFNNLLAGVMGNAGLALMKLPADSPVRRNIEQVQLASQRAAELTNQMLAYSGRGRFMVLPLNLSDLVEEMANLLKASISKRARLEFQFEPGLPSVEGDSAQLRQVVMNLITNASDALNDRDGTITVRTGLVHAGRAYFAEGYLAEELPAGDYVYVEVADTGCGMDEETQSRIFDPFFSTKFTGRGLGLAAALGIVRGHRGAFHVVSEQGKGSTIRVSLPRASDLLMAQSEQAKDQPVIAWRTDGMALVVDDEQTVRDVATASLQEVGFEVMTAADGREGVEIYQKQIGKIKVVLLDLTMPVMNGEEAFQAIRNLDPDACVVLMSGFHEQDAMGRFAGEGIYGFVQKPFHPTKLLDKIRLAVLASNFAREQMGRSQRGFPRIVAQPAARDEAPLKQPDSVKARAKR